MRIPAGLRSKDLAGFKPANRSQQQALDAVIRVSTVVQDYGGTPKPFGVVMTGPGGAGKTHLGVGLLKALRRIGFSGIFLSYSAWIENLNRQHQANRRVDPFQLPAVQELLNKDVLFMDAVAGVEAPEVLLQTAPDVIKYYFNHAKTVILTSRLAVESHPHNVKSLASEFGYPLVSRLFEACAILDL